MRRIVAVALAVLMAAFAGIFAVVPVMADNAATSNACSDLGLDEMQRAALGCDESGQAPNVVQGLINGAITVIGIVAVIMIVVAGQRYATSSGDPGQVKQARDMLIYSVIALIIASLAFAVVNFVLGGIFSASS